MKIRVIAFNTFREAVRNKVFYTLLFFAMVFAGLSVSMSTMVLGNFIHVIINMGLANIEIFGALIAIFVGINLVYKELERRTIYTILCRPIPRYQFILGKYLGLLLTLFVEVFIMSAVFLAIVACFGKAERIPDLLIAIALIYLKLAMITSVAMLFSSFSTPILSGMFTLAFFVIGSVSGYLGMLIDPLVRPGAGAALRSLMFLLPDFRFLDIKGLVVYEKALDVYQIFGGVVYALLYTAVMLALAMLIFDRKDMK